MALTQRVPPRSTFGIQFRREGRRALDIAKPRLTKRLNEDLFIVGVFVVTELMKEIVDPVHGKREPGWVIGIPSPREEVRIVRDIVLQEGSSVRDADAKDAVCTQYTVTFAEQAKYFVRVFKVLEQVLAENDFH